MAPGRGRRTTSAPPGPTSSGAICPAEGKGAGIVMPFCDTPAMQAHLDEISAAVAPGAHAVLILDKAGWHLARAPHRPAEHHPPAAATPFARTEPGREHLALHARQLALEPRLQGLRRHRRPLLRRLERSRRSAMAHPINRQARMGGRVLINARWYNRRAGKRWTTRLRPTAANFSP